MNQITQYSSDQKLRLFMSLTTVEMAWMGMFLLRARSLNVEDGSFGYSLPRLLLLFVWVIGFTWCLVMTYFIFRASESSGHIRDELIRLLTSNRKHMQIWGWLIVVASVSWVNVLVLQFRPEVLSFIWVNLPALAGQYVGVISIVGVWTIQGLIWMRWIIPAESWTRDWVGTITPKAVLLFLVAFFIYVCTAVDLDLPTRSRTSYFPELGQSFLIGRLDLPNPSATKDLTLFDGKYYVSFPPLAALLMMPFVAVRGAESMNVLLFNHIFAALGVTFTFLMLEAMKKMGWNRLNWLGNAALAIFLGFGTAQFYLSEKTLVNLISHVLTTSFLALSLWLILEATQRQKHLIVFLAGSALALAMLARPHVVFALIALAAILYQHLRRLKKFSLNSYLQQLFYLTVPVVIVIVILLWYNQARFGSPFDFGYTSMLLDRPEDLRAYGQFSVHFMARNLYDNFLRLPNWMTECGILSPNPQGTSILLTSPILVYLYRAWKKEVWVIGAWMSIGVIALIHALYYNSGAVQFGYRFSMDFMPIAVALLAFGFKDRLPRSVVFLILYSVLVNYEGVLWSTHRWCENF